MGITNHKIHATFTYQRARKASNTSQEHENFESWELSQDEEKG
jgi:hypothetical protein